MSFQLIFTEKLQYDEDPAGITIVVSLGYAEKTARVEAKEEAARSFFPAEGTSALPCVCLLRSLR